MLTATIKPDVAVVLMNCVKRKKHLERICAIRTMASRRLSRKTNQGFRVSPPHSCRSCIDCDGIAFSDVTVVNLSFCFGTQLRAEIRTVCLYALTIAGLGHRFAAVYWALRDEPQIFFAHCGDPNFVFRDECGLLIVFPVSKVSSENAPFLLQGFWPCADREKKRSAHFSPTGAVTKNTGQRPRILSVGVSHSALGLSSPENPSVDESFCQTRLHTGIGARCTAEKEHQRFRRSPTTPFVTKNFFNLTVRFAVACDQASGPAMGQ